MRYFTESNAVNESNHGEISVGNGIIPVTILKPRHQTKKFIIFIYGGSRDFTRSMLWPLCEKFARAGYAAVSFDFRGMTPNSELKFEETGLHTRIEDTRAVLNFVWQKEKPKEFILWGISMGGYIATQILSYSSRAILIAPAAYDRRILEEKIAFGDRKDPNNKFSQILRTPGSWKNSDSFSKVSSFKGILLLISFAEDTVVPPEITEAYYQTRSLEKMPTTFYRLNLKGHGGTFRGPAKQKRQKILVDACIRWLKETE